MHNTLSWSQETSSNSAEKLQFATRTHSDSLCPLCSLGLYLFSRFIHLVLVYASLKNWTQKFCAVTVTSLCDWRTGVLIRARTAGCSLGLIRLLVDYCQRDLWSLQLISNILQCAVTSNVVNLVILFTFAPFVIVQASRPYIYCNWLHKMFPWSVYLSW